MSGEYSFKDQNGFHVRHRTLGIFQGRAFALTFWHPSSAMPEHGLCRFSTREKAQALIDVLCSSDCLEPMSREGLLIEPYDAENMSG